MSKYFNISAIHKVKYQSLLTATITLFMLGNVGAAPQQQLPLTAVTSKKASFVEGEILVRFKTNMSIQAQQAKIQSFGGNSVTAVGKKIPFSKVKLNQGDDVIATAMALQSDPNIEFAQPNYIYHTSALPNDTSLNQLWGLKNTGQTISNPGYATNNPGTSGFDIDAESAWDQITDCSSTVVAVLDEGINYTHTDLVANMWDGGGTYPNHGYDFIDSDNDPMPTGGGEDHGTHVAGTIGASGNNASGVTGVCWKANIMSVRVCGPAGCPTSSIILGLEFAADNGAKVINMSLGGEGAINTLYSDAITYARTNDVVVVVAAGNGGADNVSDDNDGLGDDGDASTFTYPCNFTQDNLLCVAALDQSYSLSTFSNYGATSVDVGAPGTNVLSSLAGEIITDDFTSGWTLSGGWAASVCSSSNILSNPADWCTSGTYANSANDKAYKNFNLSNALAAELYYVTSINTESGFDYFYNSMLSSGGDPFGGGGTELLSFTGIGSGFVTKDISSCNTSACSLGFHLTSDATTTSTGVQIYNFKIKTLQTNSSYYDLKNGTSMASPHVAGIATMIRAFNPNFTYAQTVAAIKNGGEIAGSLNGKTTTGKSANAMGSLAYIPEPTGATAINF